MWKVRNNKDNIHETDQIDNVALAVPLGSSFAFNLSWADNEKSIPEKEWSDCKIRLLNTNPRSFFTAGQFTDNGQRRYVRNISQPLTQLYLGSWDPTHLSPLLSLSKSCGESIGISGRWKRQDSWAADQKKQQSIRLGPLPVPSAAPLFLWRKWFPR